MIVSRARCEQHHPSAGEEMHALMCELFPICRSITGDGLRRTLEILQRYMALEIHEVPSGTQVFDWTVPREWNIRGAYIKDSRGRTVADFRDCNLHVVNYSAPVRARLPLADLRDHLYSVPEHPAWVPYRTSYYREQWGFCLSHDQLVGLQEGEYEVLIDADLKDGALSYGEGFLPGKTDDEILISCHVCHPSLANDNLSAIAVAIFLADALRGLDRRYSYRFLFTPGCIGSIAWLALNEEKLPRIHAGLVLACLGDAGQFTYKKSRRGDSEIDRAVPKALRDAGVPFAVRDFSPFGYDERQFCSPGINLPVGCLMRTPHGEFPQYHTSADNLEFVRPEQLADSLTQCRAVLDVLEKNKSYLNLKPKCEPQLGKRGLYSAMGGSSGGKARELAMLWLLNMSDGTNSLLDIAERAGMPFDVIAAAAAQLEQHELLKPA
jgi:aminopeptidase-like protein